MAKSKGSSVPARPAPPRGRGLLIGVIVAAALLAAAVAGYLVVGHESVPLAPTAKSATTPPPSVTADFVGVAICARCHAPVVDAWRGSDHDLAMQPANERAIAADFNNAKFTYAGVTSTFFKRDGKFYVNTDGPDGKLADFEIAYTFGVHPLQQYLIAMPQGRMQALGIAWDARPKAQGGERWFHLYPGQRIAAGDPLHWTSLGQNWNYQCAECHSTNLRKNYDAAADTFRTTWSELNVACEACHGPGSRHVQWAAGDDSAKRQDKARGLAIALDERKGVTWLPNAATGNAQRSQPRTGATEIGMCARCHGRAGRLSDDYVYGAPPDDSHRLATLDEGLYWPDGQMRDEVYNWGSFTQSKMHAKGVTCSDCHDPHTLKLRQPGNAVCAQCHQPAKYDSANHTHHREGTAGAACAACHMPTTTYMVVDPRHDHSLRIPRPDLAATLGTPDACTNCHAQRSPTWAAEAIRQWTGKPPAGFQRYGEALAAGATGAPGARGALLAVINDREQPAIARASAIARLGNWLSPSTIDAVTRALNDPDPLVRRAAVGALAGTEPPVRQRYLARMAADPVRTVRMEAARALVAVPEAGLAPAERDAMRKALDEYVAAQTYNADRPEGRMNLGGLYAERGDAERAIAEYRRAIALDPTFLPAYANLADLYRSRSAENEADAILRQGLARNPRAPTLTYALGLLLARQKRTAESIAALKDAATAAPDNARFAYVHAVALYDGGQKDAAMKTLEAARKRHPYDRDVLTALAQYSAAAGRREVALDYVRQLRELDPERRDYADMAAQIGR